MLQEKISLDFSKATWLAVKHDCPLPKVIATLSYIEVLRPLLEGVTGRVSLIDAMRALDIPESEWRRVETRQTVDDALTEGGWAGLRFFPNYYVGPCRLDPKGIVGFNFPVARWDDIERRFVIKAKRKPSYRVTWGWQEILNYEAATSL